MWIFKLQVDSAVSKVNKLFNTVARLASWPGYTEACSTLISATIKIHLTLSLHRSVFYTHTMDNSPSSKPSKTRLGDQFIYGLEIIQ